MTQASVRSSSAKTDLEPLLSVNDLEVEYRSKRGNVKAVDHVSFEIYPNEVFGLAGESGCGKSTIAHAITRLLRPPAYISGGQVTFRNTDLLHMDDETLRDFRWRHLSIVFQSAMNSLNPVLTVGTQIIDSIQAHTLMSKEEARSRALELLDVVGIDRARISSYPHQLSGGMRQRVVIAIALVLNPELIIMDEPTTALDVVVQKQIMDQIRELKEQFGFSILFISHDLSLMVEFSDRVGIMYAGELIEVTKSREIFSRPLHPYTQRLMNSFPSVTGPRTEMLGIPGSPPNLIEPPTGCRFHPRCSVAIAGICQQVHPDLVEVKPGHFTACHLVKKEES